MNKTTQNKSKLIEERAEIYRTYIRTSAVGLEVGLSLIVGIVGGYLVDQYASTSHYGLFIGLTIGAIAAGKRLYTFSRQYLKENQ